MTLADESFISKHRVHQSAFTRKRALTFPVVCWMIFWKFRAAMELEIERFYREAFELDYFQAPKKSSFTKARAKLKASAFIELNDKLMSQFLDQCEEQKRKDDYLWRALRLLGIDGSTLRLPNSEEIVNHFGGMQPKNGKFVPMARISFLHDLLANVTQGAVITSYHTGEEKHAWDLISAHADSTTCFIMDRGYFDGGLPFFMDALCTSFILRVPVKAFAKAQEFVHSGMRQCEIRLPIPQGIREELEECGVTFNEENLTVRLIRVELDTGEVEVLMTNLMDAELYPAEEFATVYHLRWNVEEGYKSYKCKLEIENWSGKSVASVEQDFHAGVLNLNLVASIAFLLRPAIDAQLSAATPEDDRSGRKHQYQPNIKRGLGVVRDHLCELLSCGAKKLAQLAQRITGRMMQDLTIVRPGRNFPRNHRPPRIHSPAYKPIA